MTQKSAAKLKKAAGAAEDSLFVVDTVGTKADENKKKPATKKKRKTESGPTEEELEELLFGASTLDKEEPGQPRPHCTQYMHTCILEKSLFVHACVHHDCTGGSDVGTEQKTRNYSVISTAFSISCANEGSVFS
jgi:hypothetical protein